MQSHVPFDFGQGNPIHLTTWPSARSCDAVAAITAFLAGPAGRPRRVQGAAITCGVRQPRRKETRAAISSTPGAPPCQHIHSVEPSAHLVSADKTTISTLGPDARREPVTNRWLGPVKLLLLEHRDRPIGPAVDKLGVQHRLLNTELDLCEKVVHCVSVGQGLLSLDDVFERAL